MILRTWFGLTTNPFAPEHIALLPAQKEILDILVVPGPQIVLKDVVPDF